MTALALPAALTSAPPAVTTLAGCIATLVLGRILGISVRFGRQEVYLTWSEAAFVISLLLLPLPWLVVAVGLSASSSTLLLRRAPSRILVNTTHAAVGATAGGAAYHALSGMPRLHAPLPWAPLDVPVGSGVGIAVAAVVFTLTAELVVSAAIAASSGQRLRAVLGEGARPSLVMLLGNVAAGLGVLALVSWEPRMLLALPPLLIAAHIAYRHRVDATLERDTWNGLSSATARLASLHPEEVVRHALDDLTALFRADEIAVTLVEQELAAYSVLPRAESPETSVTRSLGDVSGYLGELTLGFAAPLALTPREEASLTTYASLLTTALRNAALHQRRAHEALHDALTGLPNRAFLLETGGALTAADQVARRTSALLLIDLDGFKGVNDAFGHAAGDQLLLEVARRLAHDLPDALVSRLGGDEFVVLLTGQTGRDAATLKAGVVRAALAAPVRLGEVELALDASIGIAEAGPTEAVAVAELLRRADVAMYQAKRERTGIETYTAAYEKDSAHRLSLVPELREALAAGEIVPYFQPKVDLATGTVVGAEALARWLHPRRGLVPPGSFMPVIEATSLVTEFTLGILDSALEQNAAWAAAGRPLPVAVNLSARLLLDQGLPERVAAMLRTHGVPAARLVLEITETVALSDLDVVESVLDGLHRVGVALSVDDFGTGYSSLTFLSRTQLHEIKIDRSFVDGMLHKPGDEAIVRATVELGRAFGLHVVAEGVETEGQRLRLLELGCETAQGFFFSRPVPGEEFARMVSGEPLLAREVPGQPARHLHAVRPA
ncbi:putative bifunctional diguanylate cyclase/phosphodiesterase [Motilibacter rhizosphaerae]|uniref:putative bifunctional diguanylate cyclase/phosphodiesterase n=1 Tax=Motilibacter rhizosphaerae TaxID=598652 RepID=UPI00102BDB95|nr:bifunctional diguanylate cyclase/phosphodiesterase [Motilibacter rhizosphaerae]